LGKHKIGLREILFLKVMFQIFCVSFSTTPIPAEARRGTGKINLACWGKIIRTIANGTLLVRVEILKVLSTSEVALKVRLQRCFEWLALGSGPGKFLGYELGVFGGRFGPGSVRSS